MKCWDKKIRDIIVPKKDLGYTELAGASYVFWDNIIDLKKIIIN